jgi:hypothetical protein
MLATPGTPSYIRMFVPHSLRKELMIYAHDHLTAGHLGIGKTYNKLKKNFYWVRCKTDIRQWCRTCTACAKVKSSNEPRKVPLIPMPCGNPGERIAMDLIGPLPPSEHGSEYCLVIEDYFTKWPEAYALPNKEAVTIADAFCTWYLTRHDQPLQVHSDQGTEFCNKIMRELCNLMDMNKTRTTSYNPKGDGLVERTNRTLQTMLIITVDRTGRDWEDLIPFCLMALRATENASTQFTPYKMMHGKDMRTPLEVQYASPEVESEWKCTTMFVYWLIETLRDCHYQVRENLGKSIIRMKTYYDMTAGERHFLIGEWFYIKNQTKRKLQLSWIGPYQVTQRLGGSTVTYENAEGRSITVNINNIKHSWDHEPRVNDAIQDVTPEDVDNPRIVELFDNYSTDTDNELAVLNLPFPETVRKLDKAQKQLWESDQSSDKEQEDIRPPELPPALQLPPATTRTGRVIHKPARYLS